MVKVLFFGVPVDIFLGIEFVTHIDFLFGSVFWWFCTLVFWWMCFLYCVFRRGIVCVLGAGLFLYCGDFFYIACVLRLVLWVWRCLY